MPSNQFTLPSFAISFTTRTDANRAITSKVVNTRFIGIPMKRPASTVSGATKRAICRELPTVTLTARSKSFLSAKNIAAKCSAAFPINAITTAPRNISDRPSVCPTCSTCDTSISEINASSIVAPSSIMPACILVHLAFSRVTFFFTKR